MKIRFKEGAFWLIFSPELELELFSSIFSAELELDLLGSIFFCSELVLEPQSPGGQIGAGSKLEPIVYLWTGDCIETVEDEERMTDCTVTVRSYSVGEAKGMDDCTDTFWRMCDCTVTVEDEGRMTD